MQIFLISISAFQPKTLLTWLSLSQSSLWMIPGNWTSAIQGDTLVLCILSHSFKMHPTAKFWKLRGDEIWKLWGNLKGLVQWHPTNLNSADSIALLLYEMKPKPSATKSSDPSIRLSSFVTVGRLKKKKHNDKWITSVYIVNRRNGRFVANKLVIHSSKAFIITYFLDYFYFFLWRIHFSQSFIRIIAGSWGRSSPSNTRLINIILRWFKLMYKDEERWQVNIYTIYTTG